MNPIERSVVELLRGNGVFYASLLSQMKRIKTKQEQVSTAGVTVQNGRMVLYWNEEFFNSLTPKEAQAVLEHECMHLVYMHLLRGKGKDHKLYNIAADIAINQKIQGLPKGAMLPSSFPELFLPSHASAEEYYAVLEKQMKKYKITMCNGKGQDKKGKPTCGCGGMKIEKPDGTEIHVQGAGSHEPWKEGDQGGDGMSELDREVIRQAVKEAYEQAQSQGKTPAGLTEAIEDMLKPPSIPWHQLLKRFVGNSVKANSKFTWKRLNRRVNTEDLKGKMRTRKLKLVAAIDTSGSIGNVDFQRYLAELRGIQKAYKSEFTVIECDADVQQVYKLPAHGPLHVEFKGRGGTDFRPVFDHIREKKLQPDVLCYLTDLYGSFPDTKPLYPVVWVRTPESSIENVPFGQIVKIDAPRRRGY